MRIYPVFHVSLLEPYKASPHTIPGRTPPPPPPPVAIDSEQEFEVEQILDSKFIRNRLHYLVKWKGYSISENSCESDHFLKNSLDLVKSFHSRHPSKPRPRSHPVFPVPLASCSEPLITSLAPRSSILRGDESSPVSFGSPLS